MTTKAQKQMEQNRQCGDPALVNNEGVPISERQIDSETGEILDAPKYQAQEHPGLVKDNGMKRASDFVESGFEEFYPDAQRATIDDVMTMGDVVILDCVIVDNFETQYGSHPLAIVAIMRNEVDAQVKTFPTSGQVVVDKLRQLKHKRVLPVMGAFVKDRRYYDLK